MGTRAIIWALIALVFAGPAAVQGCGDKFLVPSRGVRVPPRIDRASASVLLFTRPGSALSRTITTLSIDARLRKAGYRSTLVESEAAFDSVLRGGTWDVVVVDLADAPDVQSRLSAAPATVVLPVTSDASGAALAKAARIYPQVLKSPKRDRAFVDAVDKAVVARARAKTKTRGV